MDAIIVDPSTWPECLRAAIGDAGIDHNTGEDIQPADAAEVQHDDTSRT